MPELSEGVLRERVRPLSGVRVLEYAQYVAGPFASMLLADLGADVIKVESPAGDAWRRYKPIGAGESRQFHALNRDKRSVIIDLKTEQGRRHSERLIATADAVIHNFPQVRAAAYGLDRDSVRQANARAVWCSISAFGSDGPRADLKAYDLVAQALAGLLLRDARFGDTRPRRAGGLAMADFTAGLLAAMAVLAGLVARRVHDDAPGLEVSLLGAAMAVQAQELVSVEELDAAERTDRLAGTRFATPEDIATSAAATASQEELEPYYRAYLAADGFFVLACLNESQRRGVLAVTGLSDPFVANPQAAPTDERERAQRVAHTRRLEEIFSTQTVDEWIERLRTADVPAAEVRTLDHLYDDAQVRANGLIEQFERDEAGSIRQLGSLFKVDGRPGRSRGPAPRLGEHTVQILDELRETVV